MTISAIITSGQMDFLAEHVAPESQAAVPPFLARMFDSLPNGAHVASDNTTPATIKFTVRWGGGNTQTRDDMFLWSGNVLAGLRAAGVEWGGSHLQRPSVE